MKVDLIKYMLFPLLAFEPLDTVHTKKGGWAKLMIKFRMRFCQTTAELHF